MSSPKIEMLAVDSLVPYARNSRTHSPEQVAQIAGSIKEFGFTNPVLIDALGGIIAGHGRVMAATRLGMQEVPCIRLGHLSEAQKRAYVIADNRLALNAAWDNDMLKLELGDLQLEGFDLELLGFDDKELSDLLAESAEEYPEDADGEVIEPPAAPVTKLGDIWILGKHRLMCGDSTSIEAIETLCQGQQVDMWLTDPPYNVAYNGKTKENLKIKNDSMAHDEFRQFLRDAFVAAQTSMKGGGAFYIWHSEYEGFNFRAAAFEAGLTVRQCLIWNKNAMVIGRQDYHYKHEPCLYGWKDGAGHLWASDRKQTTVLEFNKPSRNGDHPTMKPVELFEYCLLNNTKGGDIVLDSFGGSGTTMIAAEKNGRVSRLMELDPKYCDVIITRWQTMTGGDARLESTGQKFSEIKNEAD